MRVMRTISVVACGEIAATSVTDRVAELRQLAGPLQRLRPPLSGFVFYTLKVRLEGHNLPRRVAGLVTIVKRNLQET
jgi:hypothetical protein